ncbi:MAG: hypothetical protein H6841_06810 [Planctomycetes bacterium]|nr:hypothetical protein [Planctomycetota bacterium]MCB9935318.1 hypothetical protein [Planctomycetota bacterium]
MRRCLLLLLLLLPALTVAQDAKPTLPRVPRGFDEGRTALLREVGEGLIPPGTLVERLFEHADLAELAGFIHLHLPRDEKRALGARLEIAEALPRCADAAAVQALLAGKSYSPSQVSRAIGEMLVAEKFSLADVAAWLYARGYNYRVLQRALNGERLDAFRLRSQLRAAKDRSAARLLVPGAWEFNLKDAREEKGGIYDGAQMIDFLLSLGWGPSEFAKLLGLAELPEVRRRMVEWGDARLIWPMLEQYVSEAELIQKLIAHFEGKDDPRLLQAACDRAATTFRWFRTGGPGVKGVYSGPWPSAKGEPAPPTATVIEIGDLDNEQFINALDKPILEHFQSGGTRLTLVLYDDGSARALLDQVGREPVNHGAASPFGDIETTAQAYEGRVSIAGRTGLLYLVFADQAKSAPAEFEFANVKLAAGESFFLADIDDGLNLTPILLRRVNPLR